MNYFKNTRAKGVPLDNQASFRRADLASITMVAIASLSTSARGVRLDAAGDGLRVRSSIRRWPLLSASVRDHRFFSSFISCSRVATATLPAGEPLTSLWPAPPQLVMFFVFGQVPLGPGLV